MNHFFDMVFAVANSWLTEHPYEMLPVGDDAAEYGLFTASHSETHGIPGLGFSAVQAGLQVVTLFAQHGGAVFADSDLFLDDGDVAALASACRPDYAAVHVGTIPLSFVHLTNIYSNEN
jgi:hypothetical protein